MFIRKDTIFFIFFFVVSLGISFCIFNFFYGTENFHFPYHDSLTFDYPNRFYVHNAFRHGILPLWDHWTQSGMPLALNSTLLNTSPIILLFSLFGPYSFELFKAETFFIHFLCFIGMFLWLRTYCNKWISLYGTLYFSISLPIVATLTNTSALTTMSMTPFIAYSLKKILNGSWRNAGLLTLFLLIIFSTGYLGLNILFLPVIFLFVYLEHLFITLHGTLKSRLVNILKSSIIVFVAVVLFFGITNFQWIQAWDFTNFQYKEFTVGWSPFDGANRLKVIFTLFFVHHFNPFITQYVLIPAPGNVTILYIGMLNLCLVIFAVLHKKYLKNTLLLLIFVIFIFLTSLTEVYATAKYAVDLIPWLQMSRWHGWYNCLIIFFLITLTCFGIKILNEKYSKVILFKLLLAQIIVLSLLIILVTILQLKSSLNESIVSLQLLSLIIMIGFSILFIFKKNMKNVPKIVFIIILLGIGLIEYIPTLIQSETYRNIVIKDGMKEWKVIVKDMTLQANHEFNYKLNSRSDSINQFITNIPSANGYSALRTVSMYQLRKQEGEKKYINLTKNIFYFTDLENNPDKELLKSIKLTQLLPNSVTVLIKSDKKRDIVWSSSYTPYWKLFINDIPQPTRKTAYGFTTFTVEKGINNIKLIYKPYYLDISIAVQTIALILTAYLIIGKKIIHVNLSGKKKRNKFKTSL